MTGKRRPFARRFAPFLAAVLYVATLSGVAAAASAAGGPPPAQGELRQLLFQKKYTILNRKIADLQAQYAADFRTEDRLTAALWDFEFTNPAAAPLFDEWVDKHPQAFQPYLGRAVYLFTRASIASRIPDQREQAGVMVGNAWEDLRKALELNPILIHPYAYMVVIASGYPGAERKRALLDQALRKNPDTVVVRQHWLRYSTPQYGGSIVEMEAVVNAARPRFPNYPGLAVIEAELDIAQGSQALERGDFQGAVAHYDRAVSRGESPFSYLARGGAFLKEKLYAKAASDFDRVIALNRSYIQAYEGRLWCRINLRDSNGALADLDSLIELTPSAENHYKRAFFRGDIFHNYEAAVRDLNEAIRLDPSNTVYRDKKAVFEIQIKKQKSDRR